MNRSKYIISFDSERLGYGKVTLNNPYGSGILQGVTAVLGENGSGKTTLGTILEKGRYAYGNRLTFSPANLKVKMLAFTDIHSLSGMEVTYYHQRMEATMNDYVPTVADIMKRRNAPPDWVERCESLGLKNIAEKKINYLSSGELRKLLIVNALLSNPDLLVLDNPYIGLDADSRKEFDAMIVQLRQQGVSTVMLLCDPEDIPPYTDNLIILQNRTISLPITSKKEIDCIKEQGKSNEDIDSLSIPFHANTPAAYSIAFEIKNGKVHYGDKQIFSDVNWKVNAGECWGLKGRNGSGKSLLLSLICADNPQAYSNDITLFDRKRGSGESIFDIKDKIGYVSPEMQLYFKSADSVREIVVQGKRNSLNRYRPSTEEERAEAMEWLRVLGIDHLSDRLFSDLSNGEQRLVLLARAFIKQPSLLVLDEPFHGLDAARKKRVKEIVNALVERNKSALIFVSHYDNEVPQCVNKFYDLSLK